MLDRVRILSTFTFIALAPTAALAQVTAKVSLSTGGVHPTSNCTTSSSVDAISADGRWVVFSSAAPNLVAGDVIGFEDVFLRDMQNGTTERISLTTGGAEPVGNSSAAAVSDDGRFITFHSSAGNLAAGDFNGSLDVFVHDRQTGLTTIVSASGGGVVGNAASSFPSISSNGLRIAFVSDASNLVANDTNGVADVFVRNQVNNSVRKISNGLGGAAADGPSFRPSISGNGAFIAFASQATNLVANHTGAFNDVFIAPFSAAFGQIEPLSVTAAGVQGNGNSHTPSLSFDGTRAAFVSNANNFAAIGAGTNTNVYLRDRSANTTVLVNALANGTPGNGNASDALISSDGLFVIHRTTANNLAAGDGGSVSDAYITQISPRLHQRASVPTGALPSELNNGGVIEVGGVSDGGRFGFFASAATNALAGEPTDTVVDLFRRDVERAWFRDFDADTFGDAGDMVIANFAPNGYVSNDLDCDDTAASVNPNATEVCNGIDDNCDNFIDEVAWTAYCNAGTSQLGCVPVTGATGFPSVSNSSGFSVIAESMPPLRPAALVYGLGATNTAWAFGSSSTRCVTFPWTRTEPINTGGTAGTCTGTFDFDWLAFMAANPGAQGQPIQVGNTFFAQIWYRDQGAPLNSNLTSGVSFTLCP